MSAPTIITSHANPHVKAMKALAMRKERKETGLFLAEGLRHVLEGIDNGWDLMTLAYAGKVAKREDIDKARRAVARSGGTALEVSDEILEKLTRKDNPQQVVGVFRQRVGKLSDVTPKKCWVALEQVRDPGNLGTIMRTIDAIGADGVILIDQCCDPFSTEAVRASMGSLFAVPFVQTSKAEFIALAQNWEGSVIGTALEGRTIDYREAAYQQPLLLVMGNEQSGLTPELANSLGTLVKLPMNGRADSLNLAIATGIMLYAALEGRS